MIQTQVTMDQFLRLSKRLDEFAQRVNGEVVLKVFPVGAIYLSLTEDNPEVFLGGRWERYAKGCCLVGVDPNDTDFSQAGQTIGSKTVSLTPAQNGAHTHTQNAHTHSQNAHTHSQNAHTHIQDAHTHAQFSHSHISNIQHVDGTLVTAEYITTGLNYGQCRARYYSGETTAVNHTTAAVNQSAAAVNQNATAVNQSTAAVNQSSGSGVPHNNIQPSVPVYIWLRVA